MALGMTLLIVTSLTGMYRVYQHALKDISLDEDIYIAVKQMSQYVIGTSCIEVDDVYTYKDFQGRNMSFQYDRGRLVKTPGYEILLSEIDDVKFEIQEDYIYAIIKRNQKNYKFLINFYMGNHDEDTQENTFYE